jgi:hypothetical protein
VIQGVYEVTGARDYRGHPTGTVFTARLPRFAGQRAIDRGSIRQIGTVEPALEPGSYQLPPGWLPGHHDPTTEAPKGASLVEGGK